MTDIDLAALVRAVINETDLTDPYEIGQKVAEQVPGKQLRPALALAVSYMARTQFGRDRMRALAPVVPSAVPPPARSAKVAAMRAHADQWRKALHLRIHIGDGERVLLADCTYEHLKFAAEERRQHAAQNAAAAELYESLADEMNRHGVKRVGDLPDAVLRPALAERRLAA